MNLDHIRKFVEIGIVVAVAIILGSAALIGANKTTSITDKANKKSDEMSLMIDEYDYSKYDGATVSGSDVIAAIKQFQSADAEICVEVTHTGICYVYTDETLTTKSTANIANAQRKGTAEYINPHAKFLGSIERDSTDNSIRKLIFDIQP